MNDTTSNRRDETTTVGRRLEIAWVWRAVGGLLALAGVGWALFSLVGLVAYERLSAHHEFAVPIERIEVDSGSGSVTVLGDQQAGVIVNAVGTRGLATPSDETWVDGTTLHIRTRCHLISNWCSLRYTVHAPRSVSVLVKSGNDGATVDGVDGAVSISSSNGSVAARNLAGSLSVTSENGRIVADNVAGDIRVRTSNGSVRATGLSSRSIDLRTANGHVTGEASVAPERVTLRSSNGGIDFEVPLTDDAFDVVSSSSNGQVRNGIRSDPTSNRKVVATTSNGRISLHYPGR
jgi:hypothetical protein